MTWLRIALSAILLPFLIVGVVAGAAFFWFRLGFNLALDES